MRRGARPDAADRPFWRSRSFWSYALLQLPDILAAGAVLWLLHAWAILSAGWAAALFVLWVAKDFAIYPVLREVLAPREDGVNSLVGARCVTLEALAPRGQVRLHGEIWQAESRDPARTVAPGATVVVRATRGITLIVEPAEETSRR